MKSSLAIPMVLVLLALILQAGASHSQCTSTSGYYVASLDGTIDPGASDFVSTSIGNAEAACAGHFVFVLNTFGGDGNSMDKIVSAISGYQGWGGTFVTLIAPPGAHAFSAGSYIAEASNRIFMVPGTTIGSATPIVYSIPPGEENTTLRKDINGFATYMEALTSQFGRNATAARLMVTLGVSYTDKQALKEHVIDGVVNATSLSAALTALGVPAGTQVATPGVRSQLISVISDPNVSSLLFLIGVFAILADIYHPTLILSIAGIVVIALALLGLGVFGAPAVSIALMIIGAAFIFLEVKTQHGVSALAGVIIFVIGFLLIFQTPPPPANPSPTNPPQGNFFVIPLATYIFLGLLGAAIIVGSVYLYRIREGLQRRPKHFDTRLMVGKEGRMTTELKAGGYGTANIGAEEWTVTSEQDIPRGSQVVVKDVKGLRLVVEKKER